MANDNAKFDRCVRAAGITTARANQVLRETAESLNQRHRPFGTNNSSTDLYDAGEVGVDSGYSGTIPALSAQIGFDTYERCIADGGISPNVTYPPRGKDGKARRTSAIID